MATDKPMQPGIVGLGRLGSNLVRRLVHDERRGSVVSSWLVGLIGEAFARHAERKQ